MAQLKDIQQTINNTQLTPISRLKDLLSRVDVKQRFESILGKNANGFMASILSLQNANPQLQAADPMSIIGAAGIAATLDMPINPNLGYAYIIPYGKQAQFQIGYKGFIQLAMRSGQYKTINVSEVYEGELVSYNRLTGETVIDEAKKKSDKVIGCIAYFRLMNGFEKSLYMSVDQIDAHARKFSKSYNNPTGPWKQHKEAMQLKTPLRILLSKFGPMSIDTKSQIDSSKVQMALEFDQAAVIDVPGEKPKAEYIDGVSEENDAIEPTEQELNLKTKPNA